MTPRAPGAERGGVALSSCRLCEGGKVNPNEGQETCALCDFGMYSHPGFSGGACLESTAAPGPATKTTYSDPGRIFGQKLGPSNEILFTVSGSNDAYVAFHSSIYPSPVYEFVLRHDDSTSVVGDEWLSTVIVK